MLAVYDVCKIGKTDDKYLKIMSSVPNAEKYDLFTVDNVLFVPLDQVYDLMKVQPDPDTVSRPQGHWIEDGYYGLPCVCSYCGHEGQKEWKYCPFCGDKKGGAV